jgi:hypothetical protein
MRNAPGVARAATVAIVIGSLAAPGVRAQTLEGRQLAAVFSLESAEPPPPRLTLPSATAPAPARIASGFVPPECRALQVADSPRIVDCWLAQFPRVAQSIRWEFKSAGRSTVLAWRDWDEPSREAVRAAFVNAKKWKAGGMSAWPGPAYADPPENHEAAYLGPDSITTVLDGDEAAWPFYATQVGMSLAAELGAWMPWSLRSYDSDALADLFDAPRSMYTYDAADGGAHDTIYAGYSPRGAVTPAHPVTTFRFFTENRLIGASPIETITGVLEWSRKHMQNAVRLAPTTRKDPARSFSEAYWQYTGKAPLSRILSGTRVSDARWAKSFPDAVSWTEGCAMTTDAFVWLLRAVNIPVRRAGTRATCEHYAPFFSGEGLYLSHGDDPYHPMAKTASFSMERLLVRAPLWNAWFPNAQGEPWCWNVGRRVIDLNLGFPSEHLVGMYCTDTLRGASREKGEVRGAFRNLYTVAQLEQQSLWDRLAIRAETSTAESCVQLRAGR